MGGDLRRAAVAAGTGQRRFYLGLHVIIRSVAPRHGVQRTIVCLHEKCGVDHEIAEHLLGLGQLFFGLADHGLRRQRIGKSLSAELGGYPAITMATIMLTGQFGAVAAPALLKLFGVKHPLAQGLAIGTASHAAGTSRAVELGDVQGAASSLAIVVTGLLTVIAAPLMMLLV